jgi:hypothetical protein
MRLVLVCGLEVVQDSQYIHRQAIKAQQMEALDLIVNPAEKAALYKKIFGDCCDVPQVGCTCPD